MSTQIHKPRNNLKILCDLVIWAIAGTFIAGNNYFTAVMLLGIGHGSPLFWQMFAAPKLFGFLIPILTGGLMAFRRQIFVASSILLIELVHFLASAFALWRTGIDTLPLVDVVKSMPQYVFPAICVYAAWHIAVIKLVITSLLDSSKRPM